MSTQIFDELGCYLLAGGAPDAAQIVDEVRHAELGLGTAFISERFNVKEAVTLSGAAGAVTDRIRIATGVTNHNTRHPLVTASFATTMHSLTGGRFALGLGRGIDDRELPINVRNCSSLIGKGWCGIIPWSSGIGAGA